MGDEVEPRPIRRRQVEQYAKDMTDGPFVEGPAIFADPIDDGQDRLRALSDEVPASLQHWVEKGHTVTREWGDYPDDDSTHVSTETGAWFVRPAIPMSAEDEE